METIVRCENCKKRTVYRFSETIRDQYGNGHIMNLCQQCYEKLVVKIRTANVYN